MPKPLLTIGMIVKNEIRCIEKCLKALTPLREAIPCELIIADTGSTDGTREVAEKYADILFDFEWVNDFSAARNAVMDRSSGQWYFSVDADEYLDENIKELVETLKHPNAKRFDVFAITIRNYFSKDLEHAVTHDFIATRIIKISLGIRYEGKIHEMWNLSDRVAKAGNLSKVILHHDGYAYETAEQKQKKLDRNLVLLREELKKNPDDLRRLMQCIESSELYPMEQVQYCVHAMELLQQSPEKIKEHFAVPLCRHAVKMALIQGTGYAEEWLQWAEEHCADSIYFRIDVVFAAVCYYHKKKESEKVIEWGNRYLAGYEDYLAGKYRKEELTTSTLTAANPDNHVNVKVLLADYLTKEERQEEALSYLRNVDVMNHQVPFKEKQMYMMALIGLADYEEAQTMAADFWEKIQSAAENGSDWDKQAKTAVEVQINSCFDDVTKKKWRILLKFSGDLGRTAQILDAEYPQDIAELLPHIENWEKVNHILLAHLVEKDIPLPEAVFVYGKEHLNSVANYLACQPSLQHKLLSWAEHCHLQDSIQKRQFYIDILMATIATFKWENEETAYEIFHTFVMNEEEYLHQYYCATILEDENNWKVLPNMHRFALWLIKAKKQLDEGDELGYVRSLHAALDEVPLMNKMVDFLLEHRPVKVQEINAELLALAQQVQQILSQFSPDDPAVVALKASPAYQKVAYLLEKPQSIASSSMELDGDFLN